jgi:hypothetical protein
VGLIAGVTVSLHGAPMLKADGLMNAIRQAGKFSMNRSACPAVRINPQDMFLCED